MDKYITASMLYNLVQCPHRVTLDLYGNPDDKDKVSPFVQLLWEKGNDFEREVIENLKIPFTDLSSYSDDKKEIATKDSMLRGDELIYSGRIRAGDLLGEPDLLRKKNQGYVAGDIKSGAGEEGASDLEDGKPKKHYAVQLSLYTDILEKIGLSAGRTPFIWDIHGKEIVYDLWRCYGLDEDGERDYDRLWRIFTVYSITVDRARELIENTPEDRFREDWEKIIHDEEWDQIGIFWKYCDIEHGKGQ